jgi:GTP cyclohydrolase IB
MNENKAINHKTSKHTVLKQQQHYDDQFLVTEAYRASLPDIQNAACLEIQGVNVPVLQVGINNFKLPLKFLTGKNEIIVLETSVTGLVPLAANTKGINMSRIMRTFYEFKDRVFTLELLEEILLRYKQDLDGTRAHIKLNFSYPIIQKSLRSGLEGYQYYKTAYEGFIDDQDCFRKRIHFDFVYASTCPCSLELSTHANQSRNVHAIPHSQRSKARVSIEVQTGEVLTIEDIYKHCLAALKTETQVMVRREDEQAFAELNAIYTKFVEDAARLLYEQLVVEKRASDFQVAFAHLESLHSHDAVAVINKGIPKGFSSSIDDFNNLIC